MKEFPIIICSSVIRSSKQGESHGGIYLVNLETGEFSQVIDWNDNSIDWEGRGADRGLRGIVFYNGYIICAASDEIFFYDQKFKIVKSFKNIYLKHCHEIFLNSDFLYISSTGVDSILKFDLKKEVFTSGFLYRKLPVTEKKYIANILKKAGFHNKQIFKVYDPNKEVGPEKKDSNHINNVFINNGNIYFSGTGLDKLLKIAHGKEVKEVEEIPNNTHNVLFYNHYLIYNNTGNDVITVKNIDNGEIFNLDIPKYEPSMFSHSDVPNDHARQGFGRGLCFQDDLIIGGSSPSTINIYSLQKRKLLKSVNLTMDIRNSIHGLEIYPYEIRVENRL